MLPRPSARNLAAQVRDAERSFPSCMAQKHDERLPVLVAALVQTMSEQLTDDGSRLCGLSAAAAAAVISIDKNPGVAIDALARTLRYSHSGTVRLVQRLVDQGLVLRAREAEDGRVAALTLTKRGASVVTAIHRRRREWLSTLLSDIPPKQLDALQATISTVLTKLTVGRESADYICRFCDESICTPDRCPVELAV